MFTTYQDQQTTVSIQVRTYVFSYSVGQPSKHLADDDCLAPAKGACLHLGGGREGLTAGGVEVIMGAEQGWAADPTLRLPH